MTGRTLRLIDEIIAHAEQQGLTQKKLAQRAGISEAGLSRMKKRGSGQLEAIERLANAAGMHVVAQSYVSAAVAPGVAVDSTHQQSRRFRDKYRSLVFSNSNAPDTVYMRRALLAPRFPMLLDAALEFGLPTLENEWATLKIEASREVTRASASTDRILMTLRRGYEQASA
ncbi:helix-turn-helix transcriptional regulator [Burkholderia sp. L27(2015)]|uniref:helix-turn-helix domain-containing protein n=1 Tax=Burkholderia sp. L27(2015) TaxID=1641858 RepID=UPI00131C040A|nr:helix-turn-helix transcriptional regulator [Burkholderia sp. L27(2015)]